MTKKKTVLITGAAGRIGNILRKALGDKYELSGIDRVPVPGLPGVTADLTDFAAMLPAFQGKEVVVHLAAEPRHTPDIGWDILIPDNIMATANVFEAAQVGGVQRVVFFSSMHVMGMYERDHPYSAIVSGNYQGLSPDRVKLVSHDMPARPDGPYAVSKLFGENLGRYYSEAYDMSVICIRLGTVGREDRPGSDPRSFVSWISHRDLAQLVERCIEAEDIRYDIFYGASDNTWKVYDTLRARKVVGYWPQDNAEAFRQK